jgi:hypothetical protein
MDMTLFKRAIVGFIFLAGIVGLVNWQVVKKSYWKYFPLYLIIIPFLEVLSYLLRGSLGGKITVFITIPLEFLFFFWLFYKNSQKKKLILIGSLIYVFSFIMEIFLAERINKGYFLSFSYSIGNLILLVFILQYFYYLIFTERILFFYQERMFWVALGLLVFYLGTFPYFGLYNLLLTKHFKLLVSYTWVEIFLDYAMYLLFAASFIWGKEK